MMFTKPDIVCVLWNCPSEFLFHKQQHAPVTSAQAAKELDGQICH